ncbi:MAG TPA: TetR/AcrR family transcriptional regulator [Arachnia sp.]|nr:TetR/AcrR family transcriptional regulator [Arachnia sp.]
MKGRRAQNRQHLEAEILRLGRAQLAESGAAALSLRAVARDLGMASSAVYRYVASRDELLTRLIVESYDELGDAVDAALRDVPADDLHGRWLAIGGAMRGWGVSHPHDWALLYGSPVPGYVAPPERTTPPGTRVLMLVIGLVLDAVAAGRAAPASRRPSPSDGALAGARDQVHDLGLTEAQLPAGLFLAAMAAWTLMAGSVSVEVFEQFGELETYEELHASNLGVAAGLILG